MESLKNKIVVITGGAKGIGLSIADHYLKNEAKVVIILDLDEEAGTNAAKDLNARHVSGTAVFLKCDVVKDLDDVSKKIFDTYKSVDVLVNNAGAANEVAYKLLIDINVSAVVGWSLKFWEHMRTDKGGKGGTIVNISSIFGFRVIPYIPVYQASKFAVLGFTLSLGHTENYRKSGVRVVSMNPGMTETKLKESGRLYDHEFFAERFTESLKDVPFQSADAVGAAAVDVYERAPSGTAWLIENGEPISEVKQNCSDL